MNLNVFRTAYEQLPTNRMEHDDAPGRRQALVATVAQLPEGDSERGAIEEYLASRVRQGGWEAVGHLAVFANGEHLPLFWSMIDAPSPRMRLAAADALCRVGHAERVRPVLYALVEHALGRYPTLSPGDLIDAVSRQADAGGLECLWSLGRVSNTTMRELAVSRAFKATVKGANLDDPFFRALHSWACLPLDAIRGVVRADLERGDDSACWVVMGDGGERPDPVHAVIMSVVKGAPVWDGISGFAVAWQNEVLFWTVEFMAYFLDPLEQWGGDWDQPWPVGGAALIGQLDPPWAAAVLEELLGHARRRGETAIEAELRMALETRRSGMPSSSSVG